LLIEVILLMKAAQSPYVPCSTTVIGRLQHHRINFADRWAGLDLGSPKWQAFLGGEETRADKRRWSLRTAAAKTPGDTKLTKPGRASPARHNADR